MKLFARLFGSPDPLAGYSPDEIRIAALRVFRARIPGVSRFESEAQYGDAKASVDAARSEFEREPSRRMRRELVGWCNYEDARILRLRAEAKTEQRIRSAIKATGR